LDKANQYLKKQLEIREELELLKNQEKNLVCKRSLIPSQLKIEDMPENIKNGVSNLLP
jgi:hypothetical protein